ncbi:MAG: hypothetical protein IIC88_03820 [Chloroflexi bacterium]|nr:hypothetical protein [Chloroflexota bacterium]
MKASTVQTLKIVGVLTLPLIAILAVVLFLFYGQSGDDSAGAAGGVGMSLKFTSPDKSQVITSTEVGSKFAIQVVTDPAPSPQGANVGGYAFGVVIPAGGGIKYNGPVDADTTALLTCIVEVHDNISANSIITTCTTSHTATKHSINVLTAGPVDDGAGPIDGRAGIELADFAYSCNTEGTYEVTVVAADPLTLGGAFYSGTNFAPFQSKTVLAQDGTTAVTASAKITCTTSTDTPTPTEPPPPTDTPTPTDTPMPGTPTATPVTSTAPSMAFEVYADKEKAEIVCELPAPGQIGINRKCNVGGGAFSVDVFALVPPEDGYTTYNIVLQYSSNLILQQQPAVGNVPGENRWPDCVIGGKTESAAQRFTITCKGGTTSTYSGILANIQFKCDAEGQTGRIDLVGGENIGASYYFRTLSFVPFFVREYLVSVAKDSKLVADAVVINCSSSTPTATPVTPTATPVTPTATPAMPTPTPTETPLSQVSPTVVAPTSTPMDTPEPTVVAPTSTPMDTPEPTVLAPTSTPAGPLAGPVTGVAGSTGGTGTDGGHWAGPFGGWLLLSIALLGLAGGATALKVALPLRDPVAQALPLRERAAGEQPQLEGRGRHQAEGLLPAGEPVQVRVRSADGFHGLVDTLRTLERTAGIARARALRIERGDGVFEVTLSAPIAPEALERAASAALRLTLRVEPDPAGRSSVR